MREATISEHVLVTDTEGATKRIGVRQNGAQHRQKPETRGQAAGGKALPEQGGDEAVRDNRWQKFGWCRRIEQVLH
jgi:hypothetical protein